MTECHTRPLPQAVAGFALMAVSPSFGLRPGNQGDPPPPFAMLLRPIRAAFNRPSAGISSLDKHRKEIPMKQYLEAFAVREDTIKSYWTKIGVAFPAKNDGFIILLDAIPAAMEGQYKVVLKPSKPVASTQPLSAKAKQTKA
jgi:hypothetical protein